MIDFNYETEFILDHPDLYSSWISKLILSENKTEGEINFIFCNDEYLLKLNYEFLSHDTFTDIISFDYSLGNLISGDVFISIERIKENAIVFDTSFSNELLRVMSHGILHLCGYKDKSDSDTLIMRRKEEEKISMFHMEHKC
jgi:probable rRNA maturation factor